MPLGRSGQVSSARFTTRPHSKHIPPLFYATPAPQKLTHWQTASQSSQPGSQRNDRETNQMTDRMTD